MNGDMSVGGSPVTPLLCNDKNQDATGINDLLGVNDVAQKSFSCKRISGGLVLTAAGLGSAGYGVSLILAGASATAALPLFLIVAGAIVALAGVYFLCTSRSKAQESMPELYSLENKPTPKKQPATQQKASQVAGSPSPNSGKTEPPKSEKPKISEAEAKAQQEAQAQEAERKARKKQNKAAKKEAEQKAASEKAAKDAKKSKKAEKAANKQSAPAPAAPPPPVFPEAAQPQKSGGPGGDSAAHSQKQDGSQANTQPEPNPKAALAASLPAMKNLVSMPQPASAQPKEDGDQPAKASPQGQDKRPPATATSKAPSKPEPAPDTTIRDAMIGRRKALNGAVAATGAVPEPSRPAEAQPKEDQDKAAGAPPPENSEKPHAKAEPKASESEKPAVNETELARQQRLIKEKWEQKNMPHVDLRDLRQAPASGAALDEQNRMKCSKAERQAAAGDRLYAVLGLENQKK